MVGGPELSDIKVFFDLLVKLYITLNCTKIIFNIYLDGNDRESKKAEPELHKVFERLKSIRSVIHLAKIDADKEHYLLHEFPIHATPTLRLFKNGKRYDYFGK